MSQQDGWWILGPHPLGIQHKHPGGSVVVATSLVPPGFLLNPMAGAHKWIAQIACSDIFVAQPISALQAEFHENNPVSMLFKNVFLCKC